MTDKRKKLGHFGEAVALAHGMRAGMVEIARNWRCAAGEIDLVMRDSTTLVFVEVRTRHDNHALESIRAVKQARLVALAYAYLEQHGIEDQPWRIDVVAVHVKPNGVVAAVEWVREAVGEA